MNHWIVVADDARCTIYQSDELLERYGLVQALTNPTVHPEADELGGRGATRSRPGGEHSRFERHTDPRDAERARFAREVAAVLDEGLREDQAERLVLVAPPKLLGELRGAVSERVAAAIVASVHHDLTKVPTTELPDAVRRHLPPLAGYGA